MPPRNDTTGPGPNCPITSTAVVFPVDVPQIAGEPYTLTCFYGTGDENDSPTFQWLVNGRVLQGETSEKIVFPSLLPSDSGNYSCVVTIGSRRITSQTMTVVAVASKFSIDFVINCWLWTC